MRSLGGVFGLLICVISLNTISAKVFQRCELAKELAKNGFPRTFISNCEYLTCFKLK